MRFVVCDVAPGSASGPATARSLGEHGLAQQFAPVPSAELLTGLQEDDWLHLDVGLVDDEAATRALVRMASASVAPLSVALHVPAPGMRAPEPGQAWQMAEICLELAGASAGILLADEPGVRLCVDDPEADVAEVATGWAEVHELALVVVLLPGGRALAAKPDGRVSTAGPITPAAGVPVAGPTFVAGFLAGYLDDPADLEGALARGLGSAPAVC